MASTNPDKDDEEVDVAGVPILARAHFYNSKIYQNFVNYRVSRALQSASRASTDEARINVLKPWSETPGLPGGLAQAVKHGIGLFDPEVKLVERIAFMASEGLGKMAIDWDSLGAMGMAAMCFDDAPILSGASFDKFMEFAIAINEREELSGNVKNPVISAAVSLCAGLGSHTRILSHALHHRLNIELPANSEVPDANLIDSIPKNDLRAIALKVKDFFGKAPATPDWAKELSSAWKAESHRRQEEREAKAAAAEAEVATATAAEAETATVAEAATATAAEGAATGAEGAATEAPEAASGAPRGTPPAGAPAVVWVVGQIVKVKFGSGSNVKAKIAGVLASQCRVEFIEGGGAGHLQEGHQGQLDARAGGGNPPLGG